MPRLQAGERIALVSDAGMPGMSDPGARIVRAALEAGVEVMVLPGPSAVETALVASGLVGERYQFVGFLPRGAKALTELWEELRGWQWPVVAFESPHRLPATLRSLAAADPVRAGRGLPRADEALRGGRARDGGRARRLGSPSRRRARSRSSSGRGRPPEVDEDAALAPVAELVEAGLPRKRAAELVARLTGAARNRLYRGSL